MGKYECVKYWGAKGYVFFEKGSVYTGETYNEGKSIMMFGEHGIMLYFMAENDYFRLVSENEVEMKNNHNYDALLV